MKYKGLIQLDEVQRITQLCYLSVNHDKLSNFSTRFFFSKTLEKYKNYVKKI